MTKIGEKFDNADKILGNITSFLLKEGDAPCSAETHLNSALFDAIELMNEEELETVYRNNGQGFDAVVELVTLRYGSNIPPRYQKFFPPPPEISEPKIINGKIRSVTIRPPLYLDCE